MRQIWAQSQSLLDEILQLRAKTQTLADSNSTTLLTIQTDKQPIASHSLQSHFQHKYICEIKTQRKTNYRPTIFSDS